MESNLTQQEKILRMTFGIMVIGYGILHHNFWGMLGVLPLVSGIFAWCPFYAMDKNKSTAKIKL